MKPRIAHPIPSLAETRREGRERHVVIATLCQAQRLSPELDYLEDLMEVALRWGIWALELLAADFRGRVLEEVLKEIDRLSNCHESVD